MQAAKGELSITRIRATYTINITQKVLTDAPRHTLQSLSRGSSAGQGTDSRAQHMGGKGDMMGNRTSLVYKGTAFKWVTQEGLV